MPLRKRIRSAISSAFLAVLLLFLAYALYTTYDTYTRLVLQQQQRHLMIIARATAQNLNLYLSSQLRNLDTLVRTPGFQNAFRLYYDSGDDSGLKEHTFSYMLTQREDISRIYLLDKYGKKVFHYNHPPFLPGFDEGLVNLDGLSNLGQMDIGSVFPIGDALFGVTLVIPVYAGDERLGTVVGVANLQQIYEKLVLPLDVLEPGNILIKDRLGRVIMHQNPEMLGYTHWNHMDHLADDARYEDMLNMLRRQYIYEEGTAIYRSFYGEVLPSFQEVSAYTRMNLGSVSWFVSAVMPVDEALKPVNENLGRFGFLVSVILAILLVAFAMIYFLQRNRQKLEMQTRYLRDLNYTLEELHQSRKQARHYQRLQTIGALAGGIVHEFNNLLTPILGYCEFLQERMGPQSEYYEDLDGIHKAGIRAKEIVQQVLPFSRRETDSAFFAPVSLDAVVQDCLKMIRVVLPSSICLENQLREIGANVYGNATQLSQAVLNICTNAYQSMEADGGMLLVRNDLVGADALPERFRSRAGTDDYAVVSVRDTGCGIPPELLKQIFDPFFTTKKAGEGTGMGLSMVQNILTNHNGFVNVESVPGQGSTFTVYLPVIDMPVVPKAADPQSISARAQDLCLLLVDDDARVARYLTKRLTGRGFLVDMYCDAGEALAAIQATPEKWDLLIADYTMPRLKGTALAKRLKSLRPELPVLLITGNVETEAMQMKQQGVLNEILIKPLEFDELLLAINRLTEKKFHNALGKEPVP